MVTTPLTIALPPGFDERKQALEGIPRYHIYPLMFYRTNLWIHGHRLVWMLEDILPVVKKIFPNVDEKAVKLMAFIHDDLEIIMGDIPSSKRTVLTPEEKILLNETEQNAIEKITSRFPTSIGAYSYKELLERYNQIKSDDIEAVIVKYCDKMDAYCEALHEIHAGNATFAEPDAYNKVPTGHYTETLSQFEKSFPLFTKIRQLNHPLISLPQDLDAHKIAAQGTLHTPSSIKEKTGVVHYDAWRDITQKYGGDWGVEMLVEQKES